MVENTNSTTLKVQGSFALTYMVGFIPLNLRSQEMDKGVSRACAAAADRVTLSIRLPSDPVSSHFQNRSPAAE
jgi:hypothetical protein